MGIGANECGINFGPSFACEALTLRQAILFASVCELLGILTMGKIVCALSFSLSGRLINIDQLVDSIWNVISNSHCWEGHESKLMLGMLCASISACMSYFCKKVS